jgi:hypothetical protein
MSYEIAWNILARLRRCPSVVKEFNYYADDICEDVSEKLGVSIETVRGMYNLQQMSVALKPKQRVYNRSLLLEELAEEYPCGQRVCQPCCSQQDCCRIAPVASSLPTPTLAVPSLRRQVEISEEAARRHAHESNLQALQNLQNLIDSQTATQTDLPFHPDPPARGQEPLIQDPLIQDPLIQDPLIQDPLIQDPLIQDPLIQERTESTSTDGHRKKNHDPCAKLFRQVLRKAGYSTKNLVMDTDTYKKAMVIRGPLQTETLFEDLGGKWHQEWGVWVFSKKEILQASEADEEVEEEVEEVE